MDIKQLAIRLLQGHESIALHFNNPDKKDQFHVPWNPENPELNQITAMYGREYQWKLITEAIKLGWSWVIWELLLSRSNSEAVNSIIRAEFVLHNQQMNRIWQEHIDPYQFQTILKPAKSLPWVINAEQQLSINPERNSFVMLVNKSCLVPPGSVYIAPNEHKIKVLSPGALNQTQAEFENNLLFQIEKHDTSGGNSNHNSAEIDMQAQLNHEL